MTVQTRAADEQPAAPHPPPALRWWREVLYIALFYGIYTLVRDTQGSAGGGATAPSTTAFRNARSVISVERHLSIYHERAIQHFFLSHLSSTTTRFFQFWDLWYGSAHFVVTAGVVIWLFRRQPLRYSYCRNALALLTAFALIGFSVFPLMPPRLLPPSYGFVDTLARFGGSWSFDSGTIQKVSNQFAANAEPPHRLVDLVHGGDAPGLPALVVTGARRAVPRGHPALHRHHRQPLLPRRRGGL